jgi:hypothetical protein
MASYAEPVVVNHGGLCWASRCESWCAIQSQWLWIMLCYTEPVVVKHNVLCWSIRWESRCVMLSQWLWIMVSYDEQVVVNHGDLWWASGFVSWVCSTEVMVVYHGVLCWASDCESKSVILIQWLWIMLFYTEPVVVNHSVLCWAAIGCESWSLMPRNSQRIDQHNTLCFTTTGSV